MDEHGLLAIEYEKSYEKEWDEFVEEYAVNGTFLQTRRFLNYHPKGRFEDSSYIVRDYKGSIVAVCPACMYSNDGRKEIYSHMGSTYGGLIISSKWYKTQKIVEILKCLENKWRTDGIKKVLLKPTPSLLALENQDLLEYCFYYLGYSAYMELNLYVDFDEYPEDILSGFAQGKRTNVHNCEKAGCVCKRISTELEIEQFYKLLTVTLAKHDKKPVHTVKELYDFASDRLREECELYGIYKDGVMIAGSMMFLFHRVGVAHAQYLCADPDYNKLSPMTYTYYAMLCEMRKRGFNKVTWGIVTEDMGRYLNEGLVASKEAFGSRHAVNIICEKILQV